LGVECRVQRRSHEDVEICELAPEFRPPEWLTDVVARTTPYFPQMGDEVIYFVQGHQQYVDAVKNNSVYRIDADRNQPWHKMPHIRVCWPGLYTASSVTPRLPVPAVDVINVLLFLFRSRFFNVFNVFLYFFTFFLFFFHVIFHLKKRC